MDISFGTLRKGFTTEQAAIVALKLNHKDIQAIQNEVHKINSNVDLLSKHMDRADSLENMLVSIREIKESIELELNALTYRNRNTCLEFLSIKEEESQFERWINYSTSTVTRESLRLWFAENEITTEAFDPSVLKNESYQPSNPAQSAKIISLEKHIKELESKVQPSALSYELNEIEAKLTEDYPWITEVSNEKFTEASKDLCDLIEENEKLKKSPKKIPDYLNPKHPCYSPKLAAAIAAWEAIAANPPASGTTVKGAIKKWLTKHYRALELTHKGKVNNSACDEISKIVNWNPEGGSTRTL